MLCPHCQNSQVFVVNSRPTKHNSQVWRRKKCQSCKEVFTTYEKIDLSYLIIIKKSNKRQRFNRAKMYSSIYHAALYSKNADRGALAELSETITTQVERKILQLKKKRIETIEITNIILSILQKKSPDIFLRYLAYREGADRKNVKDLIDKYLK